MRKSIQLAVLFASIFATNIALAGITIPMYLVAKSGHGNSIGTVTASDTPGGLLLTPNLSGLTPGAHGFHVHVNPSCDDNAMAAGGHLDPAHTNKHLGPYNNNGHLGDLPVLIVNNNGQATTPVVAPRMNIALLKGHALMIHAGGDNYSDIPLPNGGGGARIACGVVPLQ